MNNTTIFTAKPWQLLFQDPATPIMEGIIDLHNDVMFYLIVIVTLVLWILLRISWLFSENRFGYFGPVNTNTHNTFLEIVWTITPALILLVIAIPSFALLYAMDEVIDPAITIKVIGHQWYWSYEYSDYNESDADSLAFDSYLIPTDDLEEGSLRLLEVDNRVVLPILTHIRVIITGADVIHNWAVPSLGIKVDAVPGRGG
jgi:cytochrome c oxidase subunit 2